MFPIDIQGMICTPVTIKRWWWWRGGGGVRQSGLVRTSYLLALGCPLKPIVKSPNPPPFQYSPSLLQARGAYSMHFHTGPLIPRITKKIQYFGLFSKWFALTNWKVWSIYYIALEIFATLFWLTSTQFLLLAMLSIEKLFTFI